MDEAEEIDMTRFFCDECGGEIRGCGTGSITLGCSPTINRSTATKYSVHITIYPMDHGKIATLCSECRDKIISEMVNRKEST